jgi:hypothetical protein
VTFPDQARPADHGNTPAPILRSIGKKARRTMQALRRKSESISNCYAAPDS